MCLQENVQDDVRGQNGFYEYALTEAMQNMTPEQLKKMGIDIMHGTMIGIKILESRHLWQKHKSRMLEAVEMLENMIQETIEIAHGGSLVKIVSDSFLCFFPDKKKRFSMSRAIHACSALHANLFQHPILFDRHPPDDKNESTYNSEPDRLRIRICISHGPVYKRTLRIQRKTLYDYHGDAVDDVLRKRGVCVAASSSSFNTSSSNVLYWNPCTELHLKKIADQNRKQRNEPSTATVDCTAI